MAEKVKIANAFSIQMLPENTLVSFSKLKPSEVEGISDDMMVFGVESYIGHQDTAVVVSDILNVHIPANRGFLKLRHGDTLIVAQLTGGRLPEGATTLPEGFHMDFWEVHVI